MTDIKKSYYAIIPANVRYDENLVPNAKLLYGELTALCNEKGYCWAGNSYFAELYHTKEETISRWIKSLKENGYIKMEYDKRGFEIIERRIYIQEAFSIDKKVNGSVDKKVNGPLTKKSNIILHKNTTENNTEEYRDFGDTKSNTPLIKSPFVERWNTYPLLTKHSLKSKGYQEAHRLCTYLLNGSLGKHCNLDREWLERNKVPVELANKKFTEEEIYQGIEYLDRYYQEGYWPEDKTPMGKINRFATLIYNSGNKSSFFLKVMANEPQPLKKTKDTCPSISTMYEELYKGRLHTPTDRNNFIIQTNIIKKNYDAIKHIIDMTETLDSGCDSYFGTVEKFAEQHIRWMRDYYRSHLQIGSISKSWFKFLDYVKDYYHYDFDPDENKLEKMEKECKSLQAERENRKKMREAAKHKEAMEYA